MTPRAAALLSLIAAALFAIGLSLAAPSAALRPLAAALALAIILFLLPRLAPAARLIMALWPLLAVTLLVPGPAPQLSTFALWPFVAAFLASGLALMPALPDRQASTLSLLPFGAALAACLGTALSLFMPPLARLTLSTPYHFIIFLTLSTILVALADAAATGLPAHRERLIRALIGLLPLLGFLGTIAGIIQALASLPALFTLQDRDPKALDAVLHGLSTAFETTLTGLVGAALAGFLLILLTDRHDGRT